MTKHSTAVISVFALALATVGRASDSEFSTRMAAWQGGGTAAARAVPAPTEPTQASPAPVQSRLLAETYRAPIHPPNIDMPRPLCASCGHSTSYLPTYLGTPAGDAGQDAGYFADGNGYGCGDGNCGGWCGDSGPCGCNTLVWAKFDVLLWWRQGRDFPPLVTTDPISESSTTAGILPDASILFGNG